MTLPKSPTTTSSPQATPANPSPTPGSAKAKRMTATSGRTSAELLHSKDPLGSFWRMLLVTSQWVSTKCLLTWKPKATPAGRLLFQLAVSMPRTEETDSGLLHTPTAKANQMSPSMLEKGSGWWATPNTMDHLPQRSAESTEKMKEGARKGRKRPSNLREQVNPETMRMWATPRTTDATGGPRKLDERGRRISQSNPNLVFGANLADQVRMWPTPRASSAMNDSTQSVENRLEKRGYEAKLEQAVRLWPTPTTQDGNKATKKWRDNHQNNLTAAVFNPEKMWPTPGASNAKGAVRDRFYGSPTYRANLDEAVRTSKYDGQLNPTWVEWLMGYPSEWTVLKD